MKRTGVTAGCLSLLILALAGCGPHTSERPFGAHAFVKQGLRGQFYTLPKGANRLPDFARLSPKATVFTPVLNAYVKNDVIGFEGLTDHNEWFALDYESALGVTRGGVYGFRLVSDDGSRLLIDGATVIDNDGVHTPLSKAGTATLAAGPHHVEVQYFKGPHYQAALQLYCTAPGGGEALFPACGLDLKTPTKLADHLWWIWLGGLGVVAAGWWALRGRKVRG